MVEKGYSSFSFRRVDSVGKRMMKVLRLYIQGYRKSLRSRPSSCPSKRTLVPIQLRRVVGPSTTLRPSTSRLGMINRHRGFSITSLNSLMIVLLLFLCFKSLVDTTLGVERSGPGPELILLISCGPDGWYLGWLFNPQTSGEHKSRTSQL